MTERPFLRVVRGAPDARELAALVAVLSSLPSAQPTRPRPVGAWSRSARPAGAPVAERGGWRRSALPR